MGWGPGRRWEGGRERGQVHAHNAFTLLNLQKKCCSQGVTSCPTCHDYADLQRLPHMVMHNNNQQSTYALLTEQ